MCQKIKQMKCKYANPKKKVYFCAPKFEHLFI